MDNKNNKRITQKEAAKIAKSIVLPKNAIPKNAPNPMTELMKSRYGADWREAMPYQAQLRKECS